MPTQQADNNDVMAYKKLTEILERAVAANASSIVLEFESGGGLEVTYMFGNSGAGELIDHELGYALVRCIAKEKRKSRGKIVITLHGQRYSVSVRQYDSFGEPAFELRIVKPRTQGKKS